MKLVGFPRGRLPEVTTPTSVSISAVQGDGFCGLFHTQLSRPFFGRSQEILLV